MDVTERPVIRQWCQRCDKFTETWCDSVAYSRCLECDPPDRDPDQNLSTDERRGTTNAIRLR